MFQGDLNFTPLDLSQVNSFFTRLTELRTGVQEGKVVEADLAILITDFEVMVQDIEATQAQFNQRLSDIGTYVTDQNNRVADLTSRLSVNVTAIQDNISQEDKQYQQDMDLINSL